MKMVTIGEHEKLRSYMQRLIAGDSEELDENDEARNKEACLPSCMLQKSRILQSADGCVCSRSRGRLL